uniref:Uncharacterized protein n=1 Tax=Plectus sambesii TaxID=2011161 RepID=A0A914VUI8_9BILA
MWIVIGGISYLITIPDHHNTLAEKTLHHLTQPNPDGSLMQIALFCDQFDKEDVGIIEDTTVALAVPLICYLILGGSLFTLLAVLLRNRLKTRYYFGMFGAACRLGIQIGMYFIFLIVYLLAYFETSGARAVCTVSKNMCELLADIPVIKKYIYASIIATIVWLVRMLVDPVVDLVGDKRLRKALQRREAEFDDLVEMLEHNQDETEFGMN